MHPIPSGQVARSQTASRAVRALIERFPGDASHKGVVTGIMGVWLGRDLASPSAGIDEHAETRRQELATFYETQTKGSVTVKRYGSLFRGT